MGRTLGSSKATATGASGASGTPKVLFNGTTTGVNVTAADEITLFTNDALTTSVIDSIIVDRSIMPTLADGSYPSMGLYSGGTLVADYASVSGSEVVAPSTSLTCKLGTPIVTGQATYTPGGYTYSGIQSNSQVRMTSLKNELLASGGNYSLATPAGDVIRKLFDAAYVDTTPTDAIVSVPTMTQPVYHIQAGNNEYYFYYDGNSSTQLRQRSVSGGAWTTVNSTSYAYKALDVDDRVVRWADANTGTCKEHDLLTNTTTDLGEHGSFMGLSSYSCAGSVNGVLFWIPSNSYTAYLYYLNTRTGAKGYFSLNPGAVIGGSPHFGAAYNPDENVYYLTVGISSTNYTYRVAGDLSSVTTISTASSFYPNGVGTMAYMQGSSKGEMFIINSSGNMEIIKLANNTATLLESVTIAGSTTIYDSSGWLKYSTGTPSTAALSAEEYVALRCKIDGTEYKEIL